MKWWARFVAFCQHYDRYRCETSEKCFKEEYCVLRKIQRINLLHISLLYPSLKTETRIVLSVIKFIVYMTNLIFHIGIVLMTLIKCEAKDFLVVVNTSHVGFILCIDVILILQSIIVRHPFCFAHKIIGSGFYRYEDEEVTFEEIELKEKYRKLKEDLQLYLPLLNCMCGFAVVIVTPIVEAIFNPELERTYTDSGIFLHLPVPAWYPFDMDRWENVILCLLGQAFAALLLVVVLTSAVYAYFGSTTQVIVQLKLLVLSLENLEQRALNMYNKKYGIIGGTNVANYNSREFMECMENCFHKNVQHLQIIRRFISYVNTYVRRAVFFTILAGSFILAMSAFILLTGMERPGIVLGTSVIALAELSLITYICYHGQIISDLSNDLRDAVYSVQWHKCSKRFKSSLNIVQIMVAQELYIDAMFSQKANMETYANVLNTAYSYFSLLVAFR